MQLPEHEGLPVHELRAYAKIIGAHHNMPAGNSRRLHDVQALHEFFDAARETVSFAFGHVQSVTLREVSRGASTPKPATCRSPFDVAHATSTSAATSCGRRRRGRKRGGGCDELVFGSHAQPNGKSYASFIYPDAISNSSPSTCSAGRWIIAERQYRDRQRPRQAHGPHEVTSRVRLASLNNIHIYTKTLGKKVKSPSPIGAIVCTCGVYWCKSYPLGRSFDGNVRV